MVEEKTKTETVNENKTQQSQTKLSAPPAPSSSVTSPIFNSIPVTNTSTPSENNQLQSSDSPSPCQRQTTQQKQPQNHQYNVMPLPSTKQDFTVQVNKNEIKNEMATVSVKQQKDASTSKGAFNSSGLMSSNQGLNWFIFRYLFKKISKFRRNSYSLKLKELKRI